MTVSKNIRPRHSSDVKARILELQAQGVKRRDIALVLGVKERYVSKVISNSGTKLSKEQRRANVADGRKLVTPAYAEGTTERIIELRRQGVPTKEIAKEVGVDINKVLSDLQRNPVPLTPEQLSRVHRKYSDEIRASVLALRKDGVPVADIETRTSIDAGTVQYWCGLNKVVLTPEQRSRNSRTHDDAKREEVLELRRSGRTWEEISAIAGVSVGFIKSLQQEQGLVLPEEIRHRNVWAALLKKNPQHIKHMQLTAYTEEAQAKKAETFRRTFAADPSLAERYSARAKKYWDELSDEDRNKFIQDRSGPESFTSIAMARRRGVDTVEEAMHDMARARGGEFTGKYLGSKINASWTCEKGHRFMAIPNSVDQGSWCPRCANVGPSSAQIEIAEYISNLLSNKDKIMKHPKEEAIRLRRDGLSITSIAQKLGTNEATTRDWCLGVRLTPEQRSKVHSERKNSNKCAIESCHQVATERGGRCLSTSYIDNKQLLDWECGQGHAWKATANNVKRGSWCRICADKDSGLARRNGIEFCHALAAARGGKFESQEYLTTKDLHEWACAKGHRFSMRPNDVQQDVWCPECADGYGPSAPQREIHEFSQSLLPGEEVVLSTRAVIAPKELDIYVPSRKFAMEYDGIYWHSSAIQGFKKNKTRDKAMACHALGLKFLMIYSDEWAEKPELIKAMIRWRLGKFDGKRLHARKLELRPLRKNVEWRAFFDRNHLDGTARASAGFGLFLEDKMVMCATVRRNHRGEQELARLATDYDYSVAGGASRLISAIKKHIGGGPLISFSNNRLSSGNTYRSLGGVEITETTAPSYYYTNGVTRRWRFQCKRINDPEILAKYPDVPHTEEAQASSGMMSEVLFGNKQPLYKIADCGHKKWRL